MIAKKIKEKFHKKPVFNYYVFKANRIFLLQQIRILCDLLLKYLEILLA